MKNLLYLSLITLSSVLIIQVHAVSSLTHQNLPKDILSKIFFDHVQHKNLSVLRTEDSEKCISGLKEIINRFPSYDVLPFVDAWGNIPSGLLYGHLQDFGQFDECLDISTNLSEPTGHTNGKYCFASIPLIEELGQKKKQFEELLGISIGICVPDVCDAELLTEVFREAVNDVDVGGLNGRLKSVTVGRCVTAQKPSFELINIVGIIIFSTIGLLMLLSTFYDIYTDKFGKQTKEIYLAFSIVTNGRNLFKLSYLKSDNSIECLTAIRVLSMVWITYGHSYSLSPFLPMVNKFDFLPYLKAASTLHIIMGTVAVDTFLFLSGLLLAWIGFRELDKSNGRLNVFLMYFHRYMRLTTPVAAVVLYILAIDKYIGTGPLRDFYRTFNGNCKDNWWATLLYFQNFTNPLDICIVQSWYLALDTQLYFLSPLILIPLWKWGRKFVPIMFLLSFLSIGYVITTYFQYGFKTFMGVIEDEQMELTYMIPYARCSVWLVGIGLGYFMHNIKGKPIHLPKLIQILGWVGSFSIILAIIYGPYFAINGFHEKSVLEAALYESLRRVTWGIALSWIVFACHFGYGGLINSFLSHAIWQPFSRLAFSMYLVHFVILEINYGITRGGVYLSHYSITLLFWGTFGMCLMASIILTLAIEAPVSVIEKLFFRPVNKRIDLNTNTTSKPQLEPSHKLP